LVNIANRCRPESRRYSDCFTNSSDHDDLKADLEIQASDMPSEMQRFALYSASQALRLYSLEKNIAESIKQDFDRTFKPTWHCIVGKNWGSCVTHSKEHYIRMMNSNLIILLYKSS
jgi:dynein light chain LC6, flagellar outer arm